MPSFPSPTGTHDPGQSSTLGVTPSTSARVNSDSGTATTSAGIQGLITAASLPGKYRMWDKVSGCWVSRSPAAGVSVTPATATGRGVAVAWRHERQPFPPPLHPLYFHSVLFHRARRPPHILGHPGRRRRQWQRRTALMQSLGLGSGLGSGLAAQPNGAQTVSSLNGLPGLAMVPQKLLNRIIGKEYIPMYDMLPESWCLEADSANSCCQSKRLRRGLVLDVAVWSGCFAVMAAILSAAFPDKAPRFFVYMLTIVRASRTFESASYDVAYRQQAANRGSLDCGTIDTGLYNDAFTGRAKAIPPIAWPIPM